MKVAEPKASFPASNGRGTLYSIMIPIRVDDSSIVAAVTKSTVSRPTESGSLQNSEASALVEQ